MAAWSSFACPDANAIESIRNFAIFDQKGLNSTNCRSTISSTNNAPSGTNITSKKTTTYSTTNRIDSSTNSSTSTSDNTNSKIKDKLKSAPSVLEVGAGLGYWAKLLRAVGLKVWAFDITPTPKYNGLKLMRGKEGEVFYKVVFFVCLFRWCYVGYV